MGQFIFDVDQSQHHRLASALWPAAYLSGIEGVPWHTSASLDGGRLVVRRDIDESGKLFLPWPVDKYGIASLGTCSLRPRDKPYSLALELARGALYNVRTQADLWERSGLRLDDAFHGIVDQATAQFLDASGHQAGNLQDENAVAAIDLLEHAAHQLSDQYASQAIAFRKQRESKLATLVGATLPPSGGTPTHAGDFAEAFNTAVVRLSWGDIETDAGRFDFDGADEAISWATAQGMRVIGGPLLDFQDRMMPHWLYLIEDNFDALLDSVNHFAEQVIKRYKGRVQIWNCASGLNTPGPIRLTDEQVMRLAMTLVQTVRRQDPQTPVILSFDQPQGEYLAHHRDGISPIHFADALARCGLGLAGLGLELRVGYAGLGTIPRSTLAMGQMLDRWATLGLPLMVQLAVPADTTSDPLARRPCGLISLGNDESGDVTQMRVASSILRLALAKPFVHAVIWEGWDDTLPHVLPHSGLWESGGPRPLMQYFKRIRKELLA